MMNLLPGFCREQGRAVGSYPDGLCISMSERMEQRKQKRQELELRYECARKQREEENRMKEELKLTLDKLRRKAMSEQNRAALRKQKQLEKEAQQRRELLRLQHELASLHNFRRILLHYGLMPWHRFLLYCRVTYVRILRAWKEGMGIVQFEQKRSQHKTEAWTKIHSWLGEHEEEK